MTAPVAGGKTFLANILAVIAGTTGKPAVRLKQSAAQTGIANNTATPILFDTEDLDTHGSHSTSVNTSRITPNKAGWYRAYGTVLWQARTDWQLLYCYLRLNGSTQIAPGGRNAGSVQNYAHAVSCTALISFNGTTDYIELVGQAANAGAGTHSTVVGGAQNSVLELEFVRDL
jgi:hypothetical protein